MNAETIARDLLQIRAVFFRPDEPFTWASGIKSPIYCDNRLTLTAPSVRNDVENGLAELVKQYYPDVEVLMGTSTAGIAHAAIVGHLMGLPMGYVRSGAKDHGRKNQIEGRLEPGQKVVVVEDLISTGGSVIEVVNVLRLQRLSRGEDARQLPEALPALPGPALRLPLALQRSGQDGRGDEERQPQKEQRAAGDDAATFE